ncbi:hypothetical protein ON010_g1800 [Phytophthora cinnamomi]|nr:hypothetical protein ON010_g1800 [Phytophthora cinnamomi]
MATQTPSTFATASSTAAHLANSVVVQSKAYRSRRNTASRKGAANGTFREVQRDGYPNGRRDVGLVGAWWHAGSAVLLGMSGGGGEFLSSNLRKVPARMARQVMIPTIGRSSEDFPQIYVSNFSVWNARIRAALDGRRRHRPGIPRQRLGPSGVNSDDHDHDHDLKHSQPPSHTMSDGLLLDTGTLPRRGSIDNDDHVKRNDDAVQPKSSPFVRGVIKRAAPNPSSNERRSMERKTRSFLIPTIDDAHGALMAVAEATGQQEVHPYTDLKKNIEHKVLDDYTNHKYVMEKGSPEATAVGNETTHHDFSNAPHGRD